MKQLESSMDQRHQILLKKMLHLKKNLKRRLQMGESKTDRYRKHKK